MNRYRVHQSDAGVESKSTTPTLRVMTVKEYVTSRLENARKFQTWLKRAIK